MLMELIEALRKWESHMLTCKQCEAYDVTPGRRIFDDVVLPCATEPCGVGRAIILNLLKILEKGT